MSSSWTGLGWTFATTICVIWAALCVLEWFRRKSVLSKLPTPSGGGVLGQLSVLRRPDHHNVLAQWAAELGGIYRMRLAHMNVNNSPNQCTTSLITAFASGPASGSLVWLGTCNLDAMCRS